MKASRSLESECGLKYSFGRVVHCSSNHPGSHMRYRANKKSVYSGNVFDLIGC